MNYLKIGIVLVLAIFLLQSCEQDASEFVETKTTVVEGYLNAGRLIDSFKVTQSFSYGQVEDEIIGIDDLNITITEGLNQYSLTSIGDGYYKSDDLIVEAGKDYQLVFERSGQVISAETYIPDYKAASISDSEIQIDQIVVGGGPPAGGPGDMPEPIEVIWNNDNGDYYYVLITNIEEDPEFVNTNNQQLGQRFVLLTEPQITDFYAIDARRELTQYGTHEIIVYHVNAEYAALYESSGNSTLSLVEPNTNIENGLGIFTGVSSDTLYLEVVK